MWAEIQKSKKGLYEKHGCVYNYSQASHGYYTDLGNVWNLIQSTTTVQQFNAVLSWICNL